MTGPRLTPEQEDRGAELYATGASERDVAEALGCSPSTAHRLRERLETQRDGGGQEQAAGGADGDLEITEVRPFAPGEAPSVVMLTVLRPSAAGEAGAPELAVPQSSPEDEARLLALTGRREELAGTVAVCEERAAASRQAAARLDAERIEALAAGRDAQDLRPRRQNAEDDARDSDDMAVLMRQKLEAVDQEIGGICARRELARLRGELAAAESRRAVVCAGIGDRVRAAVAAVAEAAREVVAARADERAAGEAVSQLGQAVTAGALVLGEPGPDLAATPESTWPSAPQDVTPVAWSRMCNAAAKGDTAWAAKEMAELLGWLPPAPPTAEELAEQSARYQEMAAFRQAELDRLRADQQRAHESTVLPPLQPHPLDGYRFPNLRTLSG